MRKKKTYIIALDALLLALLIICSKISIQTSFLTFTLQLLMVYIIGFTVDLKNGLSIILIYILMGLLGVPVFGASGGSLSYIFVPTFGFVYGFIFVILILDATKKLTKRLIRFKHIITIIGTSLSLLCLYSIGTIHFYIIFNYIKDISYDVGKILNVAIIPYLPFDIIKVVVAFMISAQITYVTKKYLDNYHFKTIDSTSTYLKRNYKTLNDMTFVSTDYQENGHGRMNRKWESNSNENLMFSVLLKDKDMLDNFSSISIASAVATYKVLTKLGLNDVTIKWPNDVYVNGKKICGILLEGISNNNTLSCVVVGIGINVNTVKFSDDLQDKVTSYYIEKKESISINKIKKLMYKEIRIAFKEIRLGKKTYLEIANEYNYLKDKEVYAEVKGNKELVKVLQINQDNTLKVLIKNKTVNLSSGEITFHLAN